MTCQMAAPSITEEQIQALVQKCAPSILAINMTYPRKYGLEGDAMVGYATGFVVDAKLGLVLTNRHVVMDGIVKAKGKFLHREYKEEVELIPLYRDPVHDYGFFRFDTDKLKRKKPLKAIRISPELAKIGEQVVIFGNQRKKTLSYKKGKLLSLQEQPGFGMDYNTFMISASDKTIPGFSGGPVLNLNGEAVAMVASTLKKDGISYHFPLDRCVYALNCLQRKGEDRFVPRGTLQTTFRHASVKDIAFSTVIKDLELNTKSMLVVEKVLKDGPGFEAGLNHGDILLRINDTEIYSFLELEDFMDFHVGKKVSISLFRKNKMTKLTVTIQNFDEISPSELVEISNAVIHPVEYAVALYYNLSLKEGVFLATQGYMFNVAGIPAGSIIKKIGDYDTHDLDSFQSAFEAYPNGKLVSVSYFLVNNRSQNFRKMMVIDKKWFPSLRAKRNDVKGIWEYSDCHPLSINHIVDKLTTNKHANTSSEDGYSFVNMIYPRDSTRKHNSHQPHKALVHINFSMPVKIDGNSSLEEKLISTCVGVVVDMKLGLIVCERYQVPTTLGDALVTFEGTYLTTANVIFVHPFHLFSILKYDPEAVHASAVSELKLNPVPVTIGEVVDYFGVSMKQSRSMYLGAIVGSSESVHMKTSPDAKEKFVPRNFEYFVGTQNVSGLGGVFLDPNNRSIRGFNFHFFRIDLTSGIQASVVFPFFEQIQTALRSQKIPPSEMKTLGIHLEFSPLADVINTLGMDMEWCAKMIKSMDEYHRTVMVVSQKLTSVTQLYEHDVILAINNETVARISEYHRLVNNQDLVTMTVLRNGQVMKIKDIPTQSFSTLGTTRVVFCCGMVLQEVTLAIQFALGSDANNGVYISSVFAGSPAKEAYVKTTGGLIIKEVNGDEVDDLDGFLDKVSELKSGNCFRCNVMDIQNGDISTFSVKLDLLFWPLREMIRSPSTGEWSLNDISSLLGRAAEAKIENTHNNSNVREESDAEGAWKRISNYVGSFRPL